MFHWKKADDVAPAPITPDCPSCGKPMQFTRTIPKLGSVPEMRCHECKPCGVGLIEEVELEILETAAP